MANKVIFIDFDGPMIPFRNWVLPSSLSGAHESFDPIAVTTLVRALTNSKARLVISSSWREYGYEEICRILEKNGIHKECLHEDWAIPSLGNHSMSRFVLILLMVNTRLSCLKKQKKKIAGLPRSRFPSIKPPSVTSKCSMIKTDSTWMSNRLIGSSPSHRRSSEAMLSR